MKRHLQLTREPIDEGACLQHREWSEGVGAVVTFLGIVRGREGDQSIRALDYEAYEAMARHQFERIFQQMETRWPVESVRLIHRLGVVPVKDPSLWVEVTAPHRGEAFDACQFLIEEMKRVVPIWKKAVCGES